MPYQPPSDLRSESQRKAYLDFQTPHAETESSPVPNEPEVEEVDAPATSGTRKRGRAVDTQPSEPRKKRDLRSHNEQRLTGRYDIPSDAQPITFWGPADNGRAAQKTGSAMTGRSRSGPAWQPRNTLNESSRYGVRGQQPPPGRFFQTYGNKNPIKKTTESGLSQVARNGMKVPLAASMNGDGFNSPERASKKRKLDVVASSADLASEPIDLSDDGIAIVVEKVVARNGKTISPSSQDSQNSALVSNRAPPHFEHTEYRNVDNVTRTENPKPRRKKKGGPDSSQSSTCTTPPNLANSHSSNKLQPTRPTVVVIEEDSPSHQQLQANAKRSWRDQAAERPSIDLTNGLHDVETQSQINRTRRDLQATSKTIQSSVKRRSSVEKLQNRRKWEAEDHSRRSIPQPQLRSDGNFSSYVKRDDSDGTNTPPLRTSFIRDSPEQPIPTTQRAKARMKATSRVVTARVSPIRNSFGSEDELAGGNTVGSQASRSLSPQKGNRADPRLENHETVAQQDRSPSPANLRAAEFKPDQRRATNRKAVQQAAENHVDENEPFRIPVKLIWCRSCTLAEGDIQLEWDADSLDFFVIHNEESQKVPGKSRCVCIGVNEAKTWVHAEGEYFLCVQIKGSLTANSNGSMLIRFADRDGLSLFFENLLYYNSGLKTDPVSSAKMHGIFKTQMRAIGEDYSKRTMSAKAELAAERNRSEGRRRQQALEEEQIQYEPMEPEQTGRRKNIFGHDIIDAEPSTRSSRSGSLFERSPFFPSPEPRRSSRQLKPVKLKSPSPPPPERWTRINKPERWAQSVVYPPEGARRVTVDFQDLERLDEGEFLNDNVISFALRQIEENMAPEHKDAVHFFNSFFYTALTTKNGKKAFSYDAVKRWTKNKDLFNFPFVVVPINIDLHWFVAIICNLPNLSRKAAGLEDTNEEPTQDEIAEDGAHVIDGHDVGRVTSLTDPADAELDTNEGGDPSQDMEHLSLSDTDKKQTTVQAGKKIDLQYGEEPSAFTDKVPKFSFGHSVVNSKKSKKRAPPPPKKYDAEAPTIIHLDSFGSGHATETRYLKDYLNAEADSRRGMKIGTKDLQGMTAKGIPVQTNFCDCGVYLVEYVEEFANDPRKFVSKVLQRQMDQENDFAAFEPSAKRAGIRDQLLKLYGEQDAERKAKKTTKKATDQASAEKSAAIAPPGPAEAQTNKGTSTSQSLQTTGGLGQAAAPRRFAGPAAPRQDQTASASLMSRANDDEDDDLEQAVPRPLHQPILKGSRLTTAPQLPTVHGETGPAEEDDEMLDNPEHEHLHQREDAPDDDLVDNLVETLVERSNKLENHREPPQVKQRQKKQRVAHVSDFGSPNGIQSDRSSSRQVPGLDGADERELEVQDSQEDKTHSPYLAWSGTRTTFD